MVTGISAALLGPGGITGTTAQPGETVALYRANGTLTGFNVTSGSNDVYSFTDIEQPGTYKVCFPHDCYNGKLAAPAGLASADPVVVVGGKVTGSINEQQAAVTHTLTVSEAGAGSGSVTGSGISCPGTCSHGYTAGTSVSLTATPASGSSKAAKIKLTSAGKKLLKHAKHVKLTAKSTFTPPGQPAVTTTKTFTLTN